MINNLPPRDALREELRGATESGPEGNVESAGRNEDTTDRGPTVEELLASSSLQQGYPLPMGAGGPEPGPSSEKEPTIVESTVGKRYSFCSSRSIIQDDLQRSTYHDSFSQSYDQGHVLPHDPRGDLPEALALGEVSHAPITQLSRIPAASYVALYDAVRRTPPTPFCPKLRFIGYIPSAAGRTIRCPTTRLGQPNPSPTLPRRHAHLQCALFHLPRHQSSPTHFHRHWIRLILPSTIPAYFLGHTATTGEPITTITDLQHRSSRCLFRILSAARVEVRTQNPSPFTTLLASGIIMSPNELTLSSWSKLPQSERQTKTSVELPFRVHLGRRHIDMKPLDPHFRTHSRPLRTQN